MEIKKLKIGGQSFDIAPKAVQFFGNETEEEFYNSLDDQSIKDGFHFFEVKGVKEDDTEEANVMAVKVYGNTLYKVVADPDNDGEISLKYRVAGEETEQKIVLRASSVLKPATAVYTAMLEKQVNPLNMFGVAIFEGATSNIIKVVIEEPTTYTADFNGAIATNIFAFEVNKSAGTSTETQLNSGYTFDSNYGAYQQFISVYEGDNDIYVLKAYAASDSSQARAFLYAVKRGEIILNGEPVRTAQTNTSLQNRTVFLGKTQSSKEDQRFGITTLKVYEFEEDSVTYDVLNIFNRTVLISPTSHRVVEEFKTFIGGKIFLDARTNEGKFYEYNYAANTFTLTSTLASPWIAAFNTVTAEYDAEKERTVLLTYKTPSTTGAIIVDNQGNIVTEQTLSEQMSALFITEKIFINNKKFYRVTDENAFEFVGNVNLVAGSSGSTTVDAVSFMGKNNYKYVMLTPYQFKNGALDFSLYAITPEGEIVLQKTGQQDPIVADLNSAFGDINAKQLYVFANDLSTVIGKNLVKHEAIDVGNEHYIYSHFGNLYYENFEQVSTGEFGWFTRDTWILGEIEYANATTTFPFFTRQAGISNAFRHAYFENQLYTLKLNGKLIANRFDLPKQTIKSKGTIVISGTNLIDI